MKYLLISSVILLVATATSAQEYQVGQYYEPYGECVGITTSSVETTDYTPYRAYLEKPTVSPQYYPQPIYYPKVATYAQPVYYPVFYPDRRYYHGYWRSRRDYRRWGHHHRRHHGHHSRHHGGHHKHHKRH